MKSKSTEKEVQNKLMRALPCMGAITCFFISSLQILHLQILKEQKEVNQESLHILWEFKRSSFVTSYHMCDI